MIGEKKCLNSELWHACAGPLVSLPTVGSRVVYFPQGHSEQVVFNIENCCYYFLFYFILFLLLVLVYNFSGSSGLIIPISTQVAATTNKEVDGHIPNYPSLPPQLICQLHNVTMHVGLY